MSEDSAEKIRQAYAAFNSGGIDAAFAFMSPDFEWHDIPETPGGGVVRGREAAVAYLNEGLFSLLGQFPVELEELIDVGNDTFVVVMRITEAKGHGSGVPLDFRVSHVVRMREGKAVSIHAYLDRGQALEAAGLSE